MRVVDRSTAKEGGTLVACPSWVFVPFLLGVLACAACSGPKVGSVGAVFAQDKEREALVVREVPIDMTGALGGLEPGDVILTIDGNDVRGLSREAVSELLRGDLGTEVALTVDRKGVIERLRVVRGPFKSRRKSN
jgi:S1-C subfamily serine protease